MSNKEQKTHYAVLLSGGHKVNSQIQEDFMNSTKVELNLQSNWGRHTVFSFYTNANSEKDPIKLFQSLRGKAQSRKTFSTMAEVIDQDADHTKGQVLRNHITGNVDKKSGAGMDSKAQAVRITGHYFKREHGLL